MLFTHKAGLPQILCSPNFEVGKHASMSLSVGPSLPHLSTNYKFCNMCGRDGSFFNYMISCLSYHSFHLFSLMACMFGNN